MFMGGGRGQLGTPIGHRPLLTCRGTLWVVIVARRSWRWALTASIKCGVPGHPAVGSRKVLGAEEDDVPAMMMMWPWRPGRSPRARSDELEPEADVPTLVEADLLRFLIELEIQKAVRLQYSLAVIRIALGIPDGDGGCGLAKRVVDEMTRQLRATDVVTTLSNASLAILLIDADPGSVPRIVERVMAACDTTPTTSASPDARPGWLWRAGGSLYPQSAGTAEHVWQQAGGMLHRARREGANHVYLPPT